MPDKRPFVRSARLISALTLVSRVLGLLRDVICSHVFGAGAVWSAFSIGFLVPNLFRRLLGEGALSGASIPVLTERLQRQGPEHVDRLAGPLLADLFAVLIALALFGEIVVAGLFVGFGGSRRTDLTLLLAAIMLPYLIPICASGLLGGIQNVFQRFAPPAANPIVLNLFMISAALAVARLFVEQPERQVRFLAVAILVAGVVQLTWQWTAARRCGLRLRLRLDVGEPDVRRISAAMLTMTFALGAVQINTLADSLIAFWFVPHAGGPGVLYYAQRLYQFPVGVFLIALATAIFPALAAHAADRDDAAFRTTLERGLRIAWFQGLPCAVGLMLVAGPLVRLIYEHGHFGPTDSFRVTRTVVAYAAGIWAYGCNHVLIRGFYAAQDQRTPLRVAAYMVALNVALNLALVGVLAEAGLALATAICAAVQTVWLTLLMRRRLGEIDWRNIAGSAARTLFATLVMVSAVRAVRFALVTGRPVHASDAVLLVGMVAGGATAYVAAARLVRSEELGELLSRH